MFIAHTVMVFSLVAFLQIIPYFSAKMGKKYWIEQPWYAEAMHLISNYIAILSQEAESNMCLSKGF